MAKEKNSEYPVLKEMCAIHAPVGNERNMTAFVLDYIAKNKGKWKHKPSIFKGDGFQDCIVLVFGKPRTAIFAHMDSIGYTIRYNNEVVKLGGPRMKEGFMLCGSDQNGPFRGKLKASKDKKSGSEIWKVDGKRILDRGTELVFEANWRETKDYVQCCYMDNRLGVYNALKVAETLKDGAIVFSCYEEHGGGTVSFIQKFLQEKYKVSQALISDITWVTEGVRHGKGVAISMRDSLVPRRSYVERIIALAKESGVDYQLEVEGAGGSDAKELQMAAYAWDWCFVGAPEDNVHTPDEKVYKSDIQAMIDLYVFLMKKL